MFLLLILRVTWVRSHIAWLVSCMLYLSHHYQLLIPYILVDSSPVRKLVVCPCSYCLPYRMRSHNLWLATCTIHLYHCNLILIP